MSLTDSPSKQRQSVDTRPRNPINGQVLTTYTPEQAAEICDRIAQGEHLSQVLASEGMPSKSVFQRWMEMRPGLKADYLRAREAQAQNWAHEIVEISDTCKTSDEINAARLRVSARQWVASKLLPRIYGDRVQTEIGRPGEFEAIDSARLLADQIAARLGSPKLIEAQANEDDSD